MSEPRPSIRVVLDRQLPSKPVRNDALRMRGASGDGVQVSVRLDHQKWSRALQSVLPISDEKNIELDRLGAEFLELCDGQRTIESFIDLYMDRWQLSFFEARALVLQFVQALMQKQLVVLVEPDGDA